MSSIVESIRSVDWQAWLNLRPEQAAAVETALSAAESSPAILDALQKDFAQLENGHYSLASSQEELEQLYHGPLSQMHPLLTLLCRLEILINEYSSHGIPEQILIDTLSDVRIWMDVCQKRTGHPGMLEFGWLCNHFMFRLFRIGRLQFAPIKYSNKTSVYRHKTSRIIMALCEDGRLYLKNGDSAAADASRTKETWQASLCKDEDKVVGYPIHPRGYAIPTPVALDMSEWEIAIRPGDSVLDMHIAEGCPLDPSEVEKSLKSAPEFFCKYLGMNDIRALTCSSWLLDDNIAQMQPTGNIAAFQRNFYLIPSEHANDHQTRERAFGDPEADILSFECHTSLQRSIKAWYEAGRYCRGSYGIIVL